MSNSTETRPQGRLHTVAVVLASLIIPAPILTGNVVEAIMDSSNPAGLEQLNVPLAYLTEILVSSFTVLAIVLIAFLVSVVMLVLRTRSMRSIALPVIVAAIQVAVGVLSLIFAQVVSGVGG
ncbi:MAG: hypothetical protein ABI275_04975 [Terrimesophilobacter sp.]